MVEPRNGERNAPLKCGMCQTNDCRYIKDGKPYCSVCWQQYVTGCRVNPDLGVWSLSAKPVAPAFSINFHGVLSVWNADGTLKEAR